MSRPSSIPLFGFLSALLAASLAVAAGCGDDPLPPPEPQGDSDDSSTNCPIDASISEATAWSLEFDPAGTPVLLEERLCPRKDTDFWSFEISGARQLVHVDLTANDIANTKLAARLRGPTGECVQSDAAACTSPDDCDVASDEYCDTLRGVCRTGERRVCFADRDCGAAEACGVIHATVATALEAGGGGVRHRVHSTLPAFIPGAYTLELYDQAQVAADTAYAAEVQNLQDPDVGEPNDAAYLATPLESGEPVEGYFSYAGDVDWYLVDPDLPSPPVVTVDMVWLQGVTAEPSWKILQGADELLPSDQPLNIANNQRTQGATYVLGNTGPFYVEVTNPSGIADSTNAYRLTVTVIEDTDELNARDDHPDAAIALDASVLGSLPPTGPMVHTIVAQNDTDWYRIDRTGFSQNSLLYIRATAAPTAPYLLQMVTYVPTGQTCDASTQVQCATGGLCVCHLSGGCAALEGLCIGPWAQRPVPSDPGGDEQRGGRTPNHLETQLPLFASGEGAMFLQISHIRSTDVAGLAGFSSTEPYELELVHKAELDPEDQSTAIDVFFPRPFSLDENDFFAERTPRVLTATEVGAPSAGGFVKLAAGSQAVIDPLADSCVALTFEAYDNRGMAQTGSTSVSLSVSPAVASLVTDCGAGPPPPALPVPLTFSGASTTIGLLVPAGAVTVFPQDVSINATGAGLESVSLTLTVTGAALPVLDFTNRPASDLAPPVAASRFFVTSSPSPAIRVALPSATTSDLTMTLSVAQAGTTVGSADFGPTAQYCPCDADCVDVCNCAGGGCDNCACDPDPVCSSAACTCDAALDGVCPGKPAPYDVLSPPCIGTLYGSTALALCQGLILEGDDRFEVHVARTTPGAVALTASAPGYATATWVLVVDDARRLLQTPADEVTLSATGIISYDGDQDWFRIDVPPDFPAASVRLQVEYPASPVDIRFRVIRGDDAADPSMVTGFGRGTYDDLCDEQGSGCTPRGTCDTTRRTCDHDTFGTPGNPESIDPANECTFVPAANDVLYVWVNDVGFNDWDEATQYSFRVDLIEGCSSQCSPLLCSR